MARSRPRVGTVLAVVVVAATIGMWAYLFLIADPGVPDALEDDTFPTEGQAICADAVARIDELPAAQEATSPEDRAVSVAAANEILTGMVADLRAIAPTEGQDERLTRLWLEDWSLALTRPPPGRRGSSASCWSGRQHAPPPCCGGSAPTTTANRSGPSQPLLGGRDGHTYGQGSRALRRMGAGCAGKSGLRRADRPRKRHG